MNRHDYLERLRAKLQENNVGDIEEIVSEYDEHFTFKLADGHSEEEIAAKLGDPETLAEQFGSSGEERNSPSGKPGSGKKEGGRSGGHKAIVVTGLIFADLFVGAFFITLAAWVFVMAAFTVTSFVIGVCLVGGLNVYSLLPPMPYWCAALFGLSFFGLSVLSAVGTVYCAAYTRQLSRAYGRFHRNCIASAAGKGALPPLPAHPNLGQKTHRRLRTVALVSLTVCAVFVIAAFAVSALSAGALGFWHAWGWFVK